MSASKTFLCFINGEPFLYCNSKKEYSPINISPTEAIEKLIPRINQCSKRPRMQEIWGFLSLQINECNGGFSQYHTKREKTIYPNSFETLVTQAITKHLDTIFKRGLTDDEKKLLQEEKEWLRQQNEHSAVIIQRLVKKQKEIKRNKIFS